jgi:CBS domain-containing protein
MPEKVSQVMTKDPVTDRDMVRGIAAGMDPKKTPIGKRCSKQLTTVSPTDPVDVAIDLMRQKAIRRLPVVQDGAIVGIVSLGDLVQDRDPKSALANISEAPAND